MKKMIMAVAIACAAAFVQAASIGWSTAGLTNYKGDAYALFVIGQKNVTDIATITALLDAGSSIDSYAFGSGKVATTGAAMQGATVANAPTLDAGTYTSFMVLFDAAEPVVGSSKYVVISGAANQTITVASTAATAQFVAGNQSALVNNSSNWSTYGSVAPEPTSGLLLLLGMAGLALKRKVA